MISIIASIQPKWCELIASGMKTVEVRKTAPKEVPFKVLMYCTKAHGEKDVLYLHDINHDLWNEPVFGNGKVIGEFICYNNERFGCSSHDHEILSRQRESCLTMDEIIDYCNGQDVQGWHISDLIIYDKPKELSEYRTPWKKPRKDSTCTVSHIISRPPQSWMYCEEAKSNEV